MNRISARGWSERAFRHNVDLHESREIALRDERTCPQSSNVSKLYHGGLAKYAQVTLQAGGNIMRHCRTDVTTSARANCHLYKINIHSTSCNATSSKGQICSFGSPNVCLPLTKVPLNFVSWVSFLLLAITIVQKIYLVSLAEIKQKGVNLKL